MVEQELQTIYVPTADTPKPELNPKHPRLYGHILCPFVEKVRMALAARNVTYQKCEVDLGNKTAWHISINGGLVPIWELSDGTIITESKVLMDYVEESYPTQGYSLLPADPIKRARMRLGVPLTDAYNAAWYPVYMKKSADEAELKKIRESF
jgi:glutathione S-transferase